MILELDIGERVEVKGVPMQVMVMGGGQVVLKAVEGVQLQHAAVTRLLENVSKK